MESIIEKKTRGRQSRATVPLRDTIPQGAENTVGRLSKSAKVRLQWFFRLHEVILHDFVYIQRLAGMAMSMSMSMSMSTLHFQVHAIFPSPCCISKSMLYFQVHTPFPSP
jgi:hypothetical protein